MKKVKILFAILVIIQFNRLCFSQTLNLISGIEGQSTYYELANDLRTIYPELNVYSSGGSLENLNKLLADSSGINLAFVQYDVLLQMQLRNPEIINKIEIFLPMYREEVHLITKKSGNINSINDINGKKVAIGSASQGTNITAKSIISTLNLKCDIFEIAYRDAFAALLDDKIDAFFYVGGAPIKNLSSFPAEINNIIKLVPIENEKLLGIYKKAVLEKGTYPWLNNDINTISIQSFLVDNKAKDNNDLKNLLETVKKQFHNLQNNEQYHPKWKEIKITNVTYPDWPVNKLTKKELNN